MVCEDNPSLRELVFNGTLGSFGDFSSVPEEIIDALCKSFECYWFFAAVSQDFFCLCLAAILVVFFDNTWLLRPTEAVFRRLAQIAHPHKGFNRRDEIRISCVDGIGKNIAKRDLLFRCKVLRTYL